ncbi:MAG: CBS domain-containing protein [Hyphomicrobiaceae bacterium]
MSAAERESWTVGESQPIEEALHRLNANKLRILFACDLDQCITGSVTDGDIRRFLLKTRDIKLPVSHCMNRRFVSAKVGTPRENILKLLDHRIHSVPVLDSAGRLADVYTRERFQLEEEREVYSRSRSPARISFGGGGTDLTHYFDENGGVVINTTVQLFAHASLRRRPNKGVRIYSHDFRDAVNAASVQDLAFDGRLDLLKAVVRLIDPGFGFDLEVAADFPVGSGLGGSAAVTSAVIGCFNESRADRWDRHEIAEMAFQSERLLLNIPGGWQDQYATVFGGFNFMEFTSDHNEVVPLRLETRTLRELEESLVLVFTGKLHDSGAVHRDQRQSMAESRDIKQLAERQKDITREMKKLLLRGRLLDYGCLLDEAWQVKRQFSSAISNGEIDKIYDFAAVNHAIGGKLLGAGGGGYFLFYTRPFHRYHFETAMEGAGYRCQRISFDETGLQSWKTRMPE